MKELLKQTVRAVVQSRYPEMQEESVELLEPVLMPKELAKGERLLNKGEVSRNLIFVGKGMLRQYYQKNGKDVTEHFSYEGCVMMSIESLFRQTPGQLTVEALEPSIVFLLPIERFRSLMRMSYDMNMFYQRILEYSLINSQVKADSLRFETAKERYLRLFDTAPEVTKRAPLLHIASYLSMTPETLSRVRAGAV